MFLSLVTASLVAHATAPVLTFEEALAQAAERNHDIKAAQARLDQAQANSKKAFAAHLPQISTGGNYLYNNVEARIAMPTGYMLVPDADNPMGALPQVVPSGFMEAVVQPHHSFTGNVQIQQGLLMPQLWYAISNAKKAVALSEVSVEAARREVLFAVASLYYSAAGLREAMVVQQGLLEVNQAHEKDATIQVSAGAAPRLVLLRAQIERTKAEQDLLRSRNNYAAAKSALATLLDREPDFDVVRPRPMNAPAVANDRDPGALAAAALATRPDVRAAQMGIELAEGARKGVLARYAPTLALIGQLDVSNFQGFAGSYVIGRGGLALNWNLFDGGLREAEHREAQAKIAESEAQLRAAEARTRDEIRRALLELESADANRLKAEEQARLARENAGLVKQSFEAGAATYIEVVDANAALTGAELSRVSEMLNADLAAIQLARALGAAAPDTRTAPTPQAEIR